MPKTAAARAKENAHARLMADGSPEKSIKVTRRHSEATRAALAMRAQTVANKLANHVEFPSKHPMSATQVSAAKTILDKVVPSVQATEYGQHSDPYAGRSEAQLVASLVQLCKQYPELVKELADRLGPETLQEAGAIATGPATIDGEAEQEPAEREPVLPEEKPAACEPVLEDQKPAV